MKILFHKDYPKDLVDAVSLIFALDAEGHHTVKRYDASINDNDFKGAVMFIVDRSRKGLDNTTRDLYMDGFRIFAYKRKKTKDKINFYDFAMTFLTLLPKMITIIKRENSSFVYTFSYKGNRLNKINI